MEPKQADSKINDQKENISDETDSETERLIYFIRIHGFSWKNISASMNYK